jgi:hypothetical protein
MKIYDESTNQWVDLTAELIRLRSEVAALTEVYNWAQCTLTALNVSDVASGSPLHLKLREVLIAYRAAQPGKETGKD